MPMRYWRMRYIKRKHRRYTYMKTADLMEQAANLNCLLKCLSAVDADDAHAVEAMPQALRIVSEYADKLYCALADKEVA